MSVRGRIAVDVQFTDSTTTSGVQSLKTLTLQDATEYTTGKVAIVTGTCGTAAISITIQPSAYRDASGNLVSFNSVERVAFLSSRNCLVEETDTQSQVARSLGRVSVCDCVPSGQQNFNIAPDYSAGTASYTLVLYGT
jgi:hypothetical protein